MAKIEYHRDRGNYLEIYDHESLNDINDALYEYCEKTSITDAPDAFVEMPVYLRDGNDSNLLIVFYVQIMPDDFVMQLHRF
ncbi:hypothetical protein EHU75_21080 [Escherichia coli]|nr:hypothetical protein [Salmonella enterica subsp. enterica serovar Ohio]EEV8691749.1 hypothetical protein [Escherichia coli]